MKVTADGHNLKRGDLAYEIGFDIDLKKYRVTRHKSGYDAHTSEVYKDYKMCLDRCKEMNNPHQK